MKPHQMNKQKRLLAVLLFCQVYEGLLSTMCLFGHIRLRGFLHKFCQYSFLDPFNRLLKLTRLMLQAKSIEQNNTNAVLCRF